MTEPRVCADPRCGVPLLPTYSPRARYCLPCRLRRAERGPDRGVKPPDHGERVKQGIALAQLRRARGRAE